MRVQPLSLVAALLGAAACLGACGGAEPSSDPPSRRAAESRPATPRPRLVCLGDSLTAGLGVSKDEAYPALIGRRLAEAGHDWEVVNAGVSGDTSAGGLSRLEWSLDGDVRILVLALGANDGLRGLPVAAMSRNLAQIIEQAQARRIQVVLAGMEALSNMGPVYRREFHEAFPALARRYRVAFVPFLLEGVAARAELNQSDGIHPNAEGHRTIAGLLWPAIEPLLGAASSPAATTR